MFDGLLLDIDRIEYQAGLDLMRALAAAKAAAYEAGEAAPEVLILAEHDPVITLGRRAGTEEVTASPELLARAGVKLFHIERGGLATYHGPGQIVAYPVFHLRTVKLGVVSLVRKLEEAVIAVLGEYGLAGGRREGHPGVFVGPLKVASIGLAVRRSVSFHGLALNYDPDLSHFGLINPCGLSSRTITSLAGLLGRPVDPAVLRNKMAAHLARVFNLKLRPGTLDQAAALIGKQAHAAPQTAVA
ncbi:MAG: lipoyl(octanoyl) transferase LipB [Thermodesulfobacteriota bacterium]